MSGRFVCIGLVVAGIGVLLSGLETSAASMESFETLSELRSADTALPTVHVGGRFARLDGGQGIFLLSSGACVDNGVTAVVDKRGHCYVRDAAGGVIDVRWAGAKGDGKADDTAALKDAHAAFIEATAVRRSATLVYPPGTYRTRETLPLPDTGTGNDVGWEMRGDGFPTIVGVGDNFPIFRLMVPGGKSARNWKIENFRIVYERRQEANSRRSVAISLGCSGDSGAGIFDFFVQRVVFDNAWRGIAVDYEGYEQRRTSCPIWGFTIDSVTSYRGMSGATIWFATIRSGSPRGNILNFYSQNMGANEPAIVVKQMTQLYCRNLEFNVGNGPNFWFENRETIIDALRIEQAGLEKDLDAMGIVTSGLVTIRNMEVQHFQTKGTKAYFLRPVKAYVILENLYTYSNRGSDKTEWQPFDPRWGSTVEFRGQWLRHKDGNVKFDYPRTVEGIER